MESGLGTFILDKEKMKLAGLLEDKFDWASLLAAQKGVTFRVDDDTVATEFGPGVALATMPMVGRVSNSLTTQSILWLF